MSYIYIHGKQDLARILTVNNNYIQKVSPLFAFFV